MRNNCFVDDEAAFEKLRRVGRDLYEDDHGVLRWLYEVNLWKNPTICFTVGKVLLLSVLPVILIVFFSALEDGLAAAMSVVLQVAGICCGILLVLLVIAYVVVAIIYGGKYRIIFEMDEHRITHTQLGRQYKTAQAMGLLTAVMGAASGNPGMAGAGLLAASKQSMTSYFKKVRHIKVAERRHVIYIGGALERNQVYASKEDFEFVRDYIVARCSGSHKKKTKPVSVQHRERRQNDE